MRQSILRIADSEFLRREVKHAVANRQDTLLLQGGIAAQQRLDTHQQFRYLKWFPDVIVCTQFKAVKQIINRCAGCKEEHRHCRWLGSNQLHHAESIQFRHHDIGHHNIRAISAKLSQPVLTIRCRYHIETLPNQCVLNDEWQSRIVLNEQYLILSHLP